MVCTVSKWPGKFPDLHKYMPMPFLCWCLIHPKQGIFYIGKRNRTTSSLKFLNLCFGSPHTPSWELTKEIFFIYCYYLFIVIIYLLLWPQPVWHNLRLVIQSKAFAIFAIFEKKCHIFIFVTKDTVFSVLAYDYVPATKVQCLQRTEDWGIGILTSRLPAWHNLCQRTSTINKSLHFKLFCQ